MTVCTLLGCPINHIFLQATFKIALSHTLLNDFIKGIALSSTVFLFAAFRSFSQKAFLEYALQWGLVPVFQESHLKGKQNYTFPD